MYPEQQRLLIPQHVGFGLFCIATFLSFMGTSSIAYFSVIFADLGYTSGQIGTVLTSALLPTIVGILLSGDLMRRYTSLKLIVAGQAFTLLAFLSFFWTIYSPAAAAASRFAVGIGFGLFFPAALIYARSLLSGPNLVFLFGLYTIMIPLPNLVGPPLAEFLYMREGLVAVLMVFSISIAAGLLLTFTLPATEASECRAQVPYLTLLKDKSMLTPCGAIAIVGLLWGFMLSFMTLYLHRIDLSTATFFSIATGALFISRFTLMAWLGRLDRRLVASAGLFMMAIGYGALALATNSVALVAAAACIFGVGYSSAFPILSLWSVSNYEPRERGRPIALFTACFQIAILGVPALVGGMNAILSLDQILLLLAVAAGASSLVLLFAEQ